MKIVVIGGTGLIGSQLVALLRGDGHEVVPASPRLGINAVTGEGLAEALTGVSVVVDVSNSPSFADEPVLAFFTASTTNLLAAAKAAGVQHYVALSVVGTERLLESGYFRAKIAQEGTIEASSIPYTIVRATQFFEFVPFIVAGMAIGDTIRLSPAQLQPIASSDVAVAVRNAALGAPLNGMVEVAGPERIPQDRLVRMYLTATGDQREVVADPDVSYFGATLDDETLTAGPDARLFETRYEDWLRQSAER